jgi:hypothetical protein
MNKRSLRFAAAGLAVVAFASACGSNGNDTESSSSKPSTSTTTPSTTDATSTAAAGLRGALTGLLDDHVYLAALALTTAVENGGDLTKPAVKAAVATLDKNSVALADAVGGVYPAARDPFLTSWRQHIGFFVDYTLGKATNNTAKANKAKTALDGYRTSFGQLINSVVPELPADAVAQELVPHVQSLLTTIDSLVAGKADVFDKLAVAASHMPMTASVLADGIAKNKKLDGNAMGDAAALRGGLTGLLEDHVYQAAIAIKFAVAKKGNLNDPTVKAAVATLDKNSVALSKAIGAAYPAAEKPFLTSWRQHIGFFVDYTLGKATMDDAKITKAKTDLDGYRTSFGQLINSVVPELPADAVAQELVPHVQTLFDAIDAVVAGDPSVFEKVATAASHMPMTAATLAKGIATNKKIAS